MSFQYGANRWVGTRGGTKRWVGIQETGSLAYSQRTECVGGSRTGVPKGSRSRTSGREPVARSRSHASAASHAASTRTCRSRRTSQGPRHFWYEHSQAPIDSPQQAAGLMRLPHGRRGRTCAPFRRRASPFRSMFLSTASQARVSWSLQITVLVRRRGRGSVYSHFLTTHHGHGEGCCCASQQGQVPRSLLNLAGMRRKW